MFINQQMFNSCLLVFSIITSLSSITAVKLEVLHHRPTQSLHTTTPSSTTPSSTTPSSTTPSGAPSTTTDQWTVVQGDGWGGEGQILSPPPGTHNYTVIFLHGFGDTRDLLGVPNYLRHHGGIFSRTKYILPMAPERLMRSRRSLRGWAELTTTNDPNIPEDEAGLRASASRIARIIEEEISGGVPPENIALGGFSQGGAVAYLAGLESTHRIGCLFALSCWCPLLDLEVRNPSSWPDKPFRLSPNSQTTPVLHCHGTGDVLIKPEWGYLSVQHLRDIGVNVTEHLFDIGHTVIEEELVVVRDFLVKHLEGTTEES